MRQAKGSLFVATVIALAVAPIFPAGCDNSADNAASPSATAPRSFETAQSLVAHLNELSAAGPVRCRDLVPLVYPETELQRKIVQHFKYFADAELLDDAVIDRFGETLDPRQDVRVLIRMPGAKLDSEEGDRATALCEKTTGAIGTVMLVRIQNSWSISGYTFEYTMSETAKAELPQKMITPQIGAEIGPGLAGRVRSGEFASIEQVRSAFRDALLDYYDKHPEMYERQTGKPYRRP